MSEDEKKKGRRVYAEEGKNLPLAEGDYGFDLLVGHWVVRPPGRHAGGIPRHEVVEHEDGTITVSPSIMLYDVDETGKMVVWHGYLIKGEWRVI